MAGFVGVGILDDQAADQMRRAHRQLESYRRAVIVQVDEAVLDVEPRQQLLDAVGEGRESGLGQDIGLAEARQIGRDDKCGPRQWLDHLAEVAGRVGKAVQQHERAAVAVTRRPEGELDPAGQAYFLKLVWHLYSPRSLGAPGHLRLGRKCLRWRQ